MTPLGIVLLAAALILILAEAHLSTGGVIGAVAGVAAIGGVTVLLISGGAGVAVVVIVAAALAGATGSLLMLGRRQLLRPLLTRPRTGREALVGHVGVVRSLDADRAEVFIEGSLWRAAPDPIHRDEVLHTGDRVVIESVNGLTLKVRRAEEWELNP